MDAESRGGGGGGRPLRTASLPSFVRSNYSERNFPWASAIGDWKAASPPPACQAGRLGEEGERDSHAGGGGGGGARQTWLPAPPRGDPTDGGRCTIYGCGLGERGGTGEKGQRGELIPVMRTQDECLPTYPRRRREVIFAREGEVVKGFGFIARRGTVYVPMRSD